MRSSDIYVLLSKKYEIENEVVKNLIDDYFNFIVLALKEKGKFTRSRFGSFRVYQTKDKRVVYNVHTGEKYLAPGIKIISFKPSLHLKKAINEEGEG